MQNIEEITNKVQTAQDTIKNAKKQLKSIYTEEIGKILKPYPNIESLRIRINNHEFNDGEPTYFSLYYEDLTINFKAKEGEREGEEYDGYPKNPEKEKIRQEFVKFFKQFDANNFYEEIYGDEYESIVIYNSN